jgi:hypothetical protein
LHMDHFKLSFIDKTQFWQKNVYTSRFARVILAQGPC